jgi:ABC-type branched-subunit amino acid transport system ATPase component
VSGEDASPGLVLQDVFAGYGGGDVLKGISFAVPHGALTCMVGPNGAGKSTVLAVISGVLRPRSGTVSFAGQRLTGRATHEVLQLGISHVPQRRSLFPLMTLRENVELGGVTLRDRRLVRMRREALEERFPMLSQRAHERANGLSGGQQRLVEIARSLMLQPKLMILDEPTIGLEPRLAREVYHTIRDLHMSGMTILLVEQNVRIGLGMATYGVVLESGRIRLEGSGSSILANPEISGLFLGGHSGRSNVQSPPGGASINGVAATQLNSNPSGTVHGQES